MSEKAVERPEGSQSIVRAVELLSHVAARSEEGARLSQIVETSGLNIATTRRILQTLVREGLLAFDVKSKIYTVGPAIYSFAVKGHALFSRRELFMPALDAIARRTHDTVLFSVRSGVEAVCLVRREGDFPIRVMSLQEGSRRPLGAGSGSMAILAFLPTDQRAGAIRQCASQYERFRLSVSDVEQGVTHARRAGFSFNPGQIIDGVYGIGVPILRDGRAQASISVAAIAKRMTPSRRLEIVAIIREELAALPGYEVPNRASAAPNSSKDKVA
jgi:DNA-binding IclR family transcriptional regulator